MKNVDQHLEDCLAGIETLSPLELRLLDAHGCTLSEDVQATWNLPPFTNSSMDGYAVRADDVAGAARVDARQPSCRRRHPSWIFRCLGGFAGPERPHHDRSSDASGGRCCCSR